MRFSMPIFLLSYFILHCQPGAGHSLCRRRAELLPLRGGAGDDYAIVYRGIPPGTRLTVARTSDDGLWADITDGQRHHRLDSHRNLVLERSAATTPEPPAAQNRQLAQAGATGDAERLSSALPCRGDSGADRGPGGIAAIASTPAMPSSTPLPRNCIN